MGGDIVKVYVNIYMIGCGTINLIWGMVETEYDTCRNEQIHSKVMIALMGWLYGGLYKYMNVMGGNIVKVYVNIHIWYEVIPLISFDAWWKLSMVDVGMNESIVKWWLHQWCS